MLLPLTCNYQKNAHINNNMKPVATIGDIGRGDCLNGHDDVPKGEPKPYDTTFVTGSGDVYVNYKPVVTIGDIGETDCGHRNKAATGS